MEIVVHSENTKSLSDEKVIDGSTKLTADEKVSDETTKLQSKKRSSKSFPMILILGVIFSIATIAVISVVFIMPQRQTPLNPTDVYERTLYGTALIATSNGTGSGCLIESSPPRVLTNYHVVEKWDRVIVMFPQRYRDGTVATELSLYIQKKATIGVSGKVVKRDRTSDLALVELESLPTNVRALELNKRSAQVGETAYSIGCSGLEGPQHSASLWRFTTGTVRGRGVRQAPVKEGELQAMVLETQSPVNSGDSGGPVVNEYGRLTAIVCGYKPAERLVTWNIDIEEIRRFLGYQPVIEQSKSGMAISKTDPIPLERLPGEEPKPSVGQLMAKLNEGSF